MKPFSPSGNRGTELAHSQVNWMLKYLPTNPYKCAYLRHPLRVERQRADTRARGFTLLELMVVVVIITIVSTIAIPGVVKRMQTNRTRQAAEDLAISFRQARTRAMGRSSAVLVRYSAGTVEVKEAIQGNTADPGCERLPESSCLLPTDRWVNNNRSQRIKLTDYIASGDFTLALVSPASSVVDVCFAPSGRSYTRVNVNAQFVPWTAPLRFDLNRTNGVGLRRAVLVTPTGNAQVVAAP